MKDKIGFIGHVGDGKLCLSAAMVEDLKSNNSSIEEVFFIDSAYNSKPNVAEITEMHRLQNGMLPAVSKRFLNVPVEDVRTSPKVSRNSLCQCGSGKKNKRCCNK